MFDSQPTPAAGAGTAAAYRQPFADVSGVKPAVCIQRLRRPLRVLEVALEDIWTFDADLVGQRWTRAGPGWERTKGFTEDQR